MTSLNQHIISIKDELYEPGISSQRRRHLETELEEYQQYQSNNANEDKIPTRLELFCNLNPDALECRIYDN